MHVPLSPLFALQVGVLSGAEVGVLDFVVELGRAFVGDGLLPSDGFLSSASGMHRGSVSNRGRV